MKNMTKIFVIFTIYYKYIDYNDVIKYNILYIDLPFIY